MTEYSEFAANRYRQYIRQKQKESLIHRLVIIILCILHTLVRTLEQGSIKRPRRVEKVNVEQDEEEEK
jgi:Na+/proline symporter